MPRVSLDSVRQLTHAEVFSPRLQSIWISSQASPGVEQCHLLDRVQSVERAMTPAGRAFLPKVPYLVLELYTCQSILRAKLSEDEKGIKQQPAPPQTPRARRGAGIALGVGVGMGSEDVLQSILPEGGPRRRLRSSPPAPGRCRWSTTNPELLI